MTSRMNTNRPTRRLVGAMLGAGLMAISFAGAASAKEIGSGGGTATGGTGVCSPISNLSAKADPRVGELGFASIDVRYGVKPCDAGAVTVTTNVAEWLTPASVVWNDTAAPLNGKFTVNGIRVRTTYTVTVTVRSAADGSVVGTSTIFTAAIPKGV